MATIDTMYRIAERGAYELGASRRTTVSIMSVLAWFEGRLERRRSRKALLEMSDAQLKDIGLSRSDAYNEGLRSFWD
jgi:uncharacterized protein YjiS (DUF1127 family)